jgi:hypothetical protein
VRADVVRSALLVIVLLAAAATGPAQAQAGVRDRAQEKVRRVATEATPTVLLVDDDWDYQYTHPGSAGGLPYYTSALDLLGISWEVWDVQAQGQPTGAGLAGHQAVIWFTGYAYEELDNDPGVFTSQNEARVGAYLASRGNLILSSQEYYFDCCDESGVPTAFMQDYLGIEDVNDDITATATVGVSGNPIGDGLGPYRMTRPDDFGVYWPTAPYEGPYDDELLVLPTAQAPFSYASPWNTGYSATNLEGATFKTLYLAWPLEWIDTVGERAQILGMALWWMGCTLPVPTGPVLQPIDNPDGDAEYQVDWNEVTGATSYIVEEDDNATFDSPAVRYNGPNSQLEVAQQAEGTWYYRVQASNAASSGPWSDTQSTGVFSGAPNLLPIDNADGDGNYLVDWDGVGGASGYRLEEDDDAAFASPTLRYDGTDTQFQVMGQSTGTWYYRVIAYNAGGVSPYSRIESASHLTSLLYLPLLLRNR